MAVWAYDNATVSDAVAEYRALETQREQIQAAQRQLRRRILDDRMVIVREEVDPLVEPALIELLDGLVEKLNGSWRGQLDSGPLTLTVRDWWPNNPAPLVSITGTTQLWYRDEAQDASVATPCPDVRSVMQLAQARGVDGEVWAASNNGQHSVSLVVHGLVKGVGTVRVRP